MILPPRLNSYIQHDTATRIYITDHNSHGIRYTFFLWNKNEINTRISRKWIAVYQSSFITFKYKTRNVLPFVFLEEVKLRIRDKQSWVPCWQLILAKQLKNKSEFHNYRLKSVLSLNVLLNFVVFSALNIPLTLLYKS